MTTQRLEFKERISEVTRYLKWLRENEQHLPASLIATMRAAGFLMIYNVVESSAKGLTDLIVDVVSSGGHSLAELSPHLRREFLRQSWKKGAQYELVMALDDPAHDVAGCYDSSELFSGNVDARVISNRLKELGCPDINFKVRHGVNTGLLLNLKNTRNDLAHGTKSFAGIGGSAPQSMLEETFVAAWRTLRIAFAEVESLISARGHLKI